MKPKVTKRTAAELKDEARTLCPVARAELVVGDRWTVLVLRELFAGNHRFEEIQAQAGAAQMSTTKNTASISPVSSAVMPFRIV